MRKVWEKVEVEENSRKATGRAEEKKDVKKECFKDKASTGPPEKKSQFHL